MKMIVDYSRRIILLLIVDIISITVSKFPFFKKYISFNFCFGKGIHTFDCSIFWVNLQTC